jgi:hypothetical protein
MQCPPQHYHCSPCTITTGSPSDSTSAMISCILLHTKSVACACIYAKAATAHLQLQRLLVDVSAALPQHHPAVGRAGRVGHRVDRLAAPRQQRSPQARLAGHHLGGAALLALHSEVAGLVLQAQEHVAAQNRNVMAAVSNEAPPGLRGTPCTARSGSWPCAAGRNGKLQHTRSPLSQQMHEVVRLQA